MSQRPCVYVFAIRCREGQPNGNAHCRRPDCALLQEVIICTHGAIQCGLPIALCYVGREQAQQGAERTLHMTTAVGQELETAHISPTNREELEQGVDRKHTEYSAGGKAWCGCLRRRREWAGAGCPTLSTRSCCSAPAWPRTPPRSGQSSPARESPCTCVPMWRHRGSIPCTICTQL